jgi:hypothetical protein
MTRRMILALLACLAVASAAPAQTAAWRFRWQAGQVLTYRVEHVTSTSQVVGDNKDTVTHKVRLVKRWQVQEVDAAGVATLQLSLAALRNEITRPGGQVLLFDSADPDHSDPDMREQLSKYVGRRLAVIRVDGRGNVVEVKESTDGPASRFESDPPFKITLPEGAARPGSEWSRSYRVVLAPPLGTGEKYDASQKYTCKAVEGAGATITLTTALANPPESLSDQVPLLQMQPEGEVVFDTAAGRLHSARLRIDKELKGHQGEGSSYHFQSSYTEEYAGDK